jgi:choline dehydrogenase-like flavoprotein
MAYLTLDPQVQRERQTVNYSAKVVETTWSSYFTAENTANDSDRSMWENVAHSLRSLWQNIDADVVSDFRPGDRNAKMYKIVTTQEQAPNPSSRVRLAQERDALGMLRPALEWRLSDLDRHSISVAVEELVKALGSSGIAKLHVPLDIRRSGWPVDVPFSWHHCGTTRMSDDPAKGVVNADGRVHGVENLYVAGSSVFPTSGAGNPTLTIVALALRLANHLQEST